MMKKFKIFWNMAEEEKWLNEMAAKGHILKKYSAFGVYTFVDGTPQALNYKVDYKLFKRKADYQSYLALFEDAGWEHVYGTKGGGSHYFLPKVPEAGTEIFSDTESAAARYKVLYQICCCNAFIFIACIMMLWMNNGFNLSAFGFLTPGLWEKTGADFWKSFFFELPFVVLRVGCLLWFVVTGVMYGYWGSKAKQEYKRLMKGQKI